MIHDERHAAHRIGLLRAMVLGANDGLISTGCLILGVAAAASSDRAAILTAGMAGLVAGAVAMALGEYVSVSSQRDSEQSDIAKEKWELETMPDHELDELTAMYVDKGLSATLAREVAVELTKLDPLKIHLAEELGISELTLANPLQAALGSAFSFTLGSAIPLITAAVASAHARTTTTLIVTTLSLGALGWGGARFGRASVGKPMARVVIGGIAAMAFTMTVGKIFGAAIA
ncbi:MAG: VIT family protein [Actinomycetes bacterium]|jgi:VIT1/CCC1 family predicted Fe2+/Mn2+ transporter